MSINVPTPMIGRRAAVLAAAAAVGFSRAVDAASGAVVTPRQTEGPYYPVDWAGDSDWDLVQVRGEAARASGQVAHLRGRVHDAAGRAIPRARVEIWQCDAFGVYRHPRDERGGRRREAGFQGRGADESADDGAFRFRTIRPVAYPGRTPHIHVRVAAPGRPVLITQLYVRGEPLNARDSLLNSIADPRQRESVLVRFEDAERLEPGALVGDVVIVLA